MGKIYDRNSVTLVMSKDLLALRKTQNADRTNCPELIFDHDEAQSLWATLRGADASIKADALALYGETLNAKGTYVEQLVAAVSSEQTSKRTGERYTRNDAWSPAQLKAHKPTLVRLEVGFYGQPQLCAYLVAPPTRASGGTKARVVPAVTRIDVASPEGKAIADKHARPPVRRIG